MKEDLRVAKTKKAIEEAFLELARTKGYENVHIVDIAKAAMVNRNTIYLHYGSKEGIVQEIVERDFMTRISGFTDPNKPLPRIKSRKDIHALFEAIFSIVNDNIEIYRTILLEPSLSGYMANNTKRITAFILKEMEDIPKNKIILGFITAGVYDVLSKWIVYATGTLEENVNYLTDLTMSNIRKCSYKH